MKTISNRKLSFGIVVAPGAQVHIQLRANRTLERNHSALDDPARFYAENNSTPLGVT
jgi:hypothetical protein